jgi:hypothetical protein
MEIENNIEVLKIIYPENNGKEEVRVGLLTMNYSPLKQQNSASYLFLFKWD